MEVARLYATPLKVRIPFRRDWVGTVRSTSTALGNADELIVTKINVLFFLIVRQGSRNAISPGCRGGTHRATQSYEMVSSPSTASRITWLLPCYARWWQPTLRSRGIGISPTVQKLWNLMPLGKDPTWATVPTRRIFRARPSMKVTSSTSVGRIIR